MSKWCCAVLWSWLLAVGCQQGEQSSEPVWKRSDYGQDIERICYSEQHSGALAVAEGERALVVAQWLGSNLKTKEAHAFLVALRQAASPEQKVSLLVQESTRLGLPECPLAKTWGG